MVGERGERHEMQALYWHGAYRLEGASPKSAWGQGNEIGRQMHLNRTIPEITGECFYSTRPLLRNPRHVCDTIQLIYKDDKAQKAPLLLPWE